MSPTNEQQDGTGHRWAVYGATAAAVTAALPPYTAWCAFAIALNGDIAYRNRSRPRLRRPR